MAHLNPVPLADVKEAAALANRGAALLAADRHGEALAAYRQALLALADAGSAHG